MCVINVVDNTIHASSVSGPTDISEQTKGTIEWIYIIGQPVKFWLTLYYEWVQELNKLKEG